jgi:hypothetical protein
LDDMYEEQTSWFIISLSWCMFDVCPLSLLLLLVSCSPYLFSFTSLSWCLSTVTVAAACDGDDSNDEVTKHTYIKIS